MRKFISEYTSPLGIIQLESDGEYLTGLHFKNVLDNKIISNYEDKDLEIFEETKKWLNIYFNGINPTFTPKYRIDSLSTFQKEINSIIAKISYGTTITYGEIAKEIAIKHHIKRMSSQAIGQAVSNNPICIIVPCHRVIGAKNNITGYSGGITNKLKLLELEGTNISSFVLPKKNIKRCKWCNLNNHNYITYHDNEWGKLNTDERYLFEMLILESFQAGLSWECILNKRNAFRKAYDNFEIDKILNYDERKIKQLSNNKQIVRNKRKIIASINNAKIFKQIQNEFKSFYQYLCTFTGGKTYFETGLTTNELSDKLSLDLRQRGMKFVGSTIIYSYLQAIGVINSHEPDCFLYHYVK